jgi:hypothetical protein
MSCLENILTLLVLHAKCFYMWKGNHRLMILWRHINNHHLINKVWHIFNNNMIIDPRTYTIVFVNIINDIVGAHRHRTKSSGLSNF